MSAKTAEPVARSRGAALLPWVPAILGLVVLLRGVYLLARAPLYGEDVTSLMFFARQGFERAWADFSGPMFGLSSVRFYRPLLSLSLAAQTAISFDPAWLRIANVLTYALGLAATARWLHHWKVPIATALVATIGVGAFPGGPGDWCWIVGRVDSFSFGFGMAGLALLAHPEPGRWAWRTAAASVAFAAAFLSKETALFFGPVALLFGLAQLGRCGVLRALAPCAVLGALFLVRWWALDFSMGGYVGASPTSGAALATLAPNELAKGLSLMSGIPRAAAGYVGLALLVFFGFTSLKVSRQPALLWAAIAGAAALYVPGALVVAGLGDPPPVHARVFPGAFALLMGAVSIALGEWCGPDAPDRRQRIFVALGLAFVIPPALAVDAAIGAYREGARALTQEQERIDAARRALGDHSPLLLVAGVHHGWPPDRTQVHFHNLGLTERFVAPFDESRGAAVWPLRPVGNSPAGEPFRCSRDSELAQAVLLPTDGRPIPGVLLDDDRAEPVRLNPDAIPAALSGEDALAMRDQGFDRDLSLPAVVGAERLRVTVMTPQGFDVAELPSLKPTWKGLLTAQTSTGIPLFEVPGFAVDFGADSFAVRFEWLGDGGDRLAESGLRLVSLTPSFAEFIRREVADPRFGVGRARPR
ncbi:MAG: hypothetical protein JNJ88_01295 [Planctomycetes bacterium]|nr:hypothetical protein [Planctomycetota bacterium]